MRPARTLILFFQLWCSTSIAEPSCSLNPLEALVPKSVKSIARRLKEANSGCIENLYPALPTGETCANLPSRTTSDTNFQKLRADCDLKDEVEKEKKNPGEQMQMDRWLTLHSYIDRDKKIELIYEASKQQKMPPEVLYGVLHLETRVTDLGIIYDGNNYSCGAGSLNIYQWCRWMNTQSTKRQNQLAWPVGIDCSEETLSPEMVGSVYAHVDFSHSSTKPTHSYLSDWEIQMRPKEANSVSDGAIQKIGKQKISAIQLKAIRSFTNNCGEIENSIPAAAYSLRDLFDRLVPTGFKVKDLTKPNTVCKYPNDTGYSSLHVGWLLAYGIYNAGEDFGEHLKELSKTKKFPKIYQDARPKSLEDLVDLFNRQDKIQFRKASGNIGNVINRIDPNLKNPFLK